MTIVAEAGVVYVAGVDSDITEHSGITFTYAVIQNNCSLTICWRMINGIG